MTPEREEEDASVLRMVCWSAGVIKFPQASDSAQLTVRCQKSISDLSRGFPCLNAKYACLKVSIEQSKPSLLFFSTKMFFEQQAAFSFSCLRLILLRFVSKELQKKDEVNIF